MRRRAGREEPAIKVSVWAETETHLCGCVGNVSLRLILSLALFLSLQIDKPFAGKQAIGHLPRNFDAN